MANRVWFANKSVDTFISNMFDKINVPPFRFALRTIVSRSQFRRQTRIIIII